VIRKNGSDTKILQDNWSVDTFDGDGISGVTLDTSKAQIFLIDYEWLGVGRVRFGFVIDGLIYYCHHENHANSATSVYTSTSNHPIRYEISSSNGSGSLQHICSSIISEGGLEPIGILRSHSTQGTHIYADTMDVIYAMLGVRLKSTHLDATILPNDVSVLAETNDSFRWILSLNPTIADTFSYSDLSNSACQIATGVTANTVSNLGIVIQQGYVSQQGRSVESPVSNALSLGSLIDGTPDELVLSVMPLSNASDIQAAINWRELW
jgi:hypothetical protein